MPRSRRRSRPAADSAPCIPSWNVKAFRQACSIGGTQVGRQLYTAQSVELALQRDDAGAAHVAIFLDGFAANPSSIGPLAFMLLDATLGEHNLMTKLVGLDFFDRTAAIASGERRPLTELPAALGD